MQLSPINSDIYFIKLNRTEQELAFQIKKFAFKEHIEIKWGWDQNFQRKFHAKQFFDRNVLGIHENATLIGTIALDRLEGALELNDFYLLPEFQNSGLGGRILTHVMNEAAKLRLPIKLKVLKWNPAKDFYRRNGFIQVTGTDVHYCLEWNYNKLMKL